MDIIGKMKHSPIRNYAIPGLTSWLIGEPNENGCIRLFECERNHIEPIIPHSHRFDFECVVLSGTVINSVWEATEDEDADLYQSSVLNYCGKPGDYTTSSYLTRRWRVIDQKYQAGDRYAMKAEEIHSIRFYAHTQVLFFEGPKKNDVSMILQPVVDGEVIPTFEVKPWMFKRGDK